MSAKAHVTEDWVNMSLRLAVMRDQGNSRTMVVWPEHGLTLKHLTGEERAAEIPGTWLSIPEDMAHAIYEALAEHFGHGGHDTRALRRDYDAERKRVDQFIAHLTKPPGG